MRATIVLDDDLNQVLREKQAALIKKTSKNQSFSQVVNDVIRKGLGK